MKRTLICAALTLGMVALPVVSEAHGWEGRGGHGGYNYGHGGYYHGGGFGRVVAFPFLLGAAAVGAVATIAAAPFNATYVAPPPAPVYYGTPAPAYGYAPAPYGYAAPPQTCTYYPDGSSYCR